MKLTKKQKFALDLLSDNSKIFYLFDGSSRSGKTVILIKFICIYAFAFPGINILIARYRFNHAKASVWTQTLLPILKSQYDGYYNINKSDYIVNFTNGSTIELGGLEAGDRLDKILGTEWAIIFINEVVENPYSTFETLITRLNNQNVSVKFLADCNPKNPGHWCNRRFIQNLNPETKKKLTVKEIHQQVRLHWDVRDNKENLSVDYIDMLGNLTGIKRKRFFEGIWSEISEGAVYRFNREINHVDLPIDYNPGAKVWTFWDFGIADNVFIGWLQIIPVPNVKHGVEIHIIDEYVNNEKDYKFYADIVNSKPYKNVSHAGDPAGRQRNASLQSWFSLLSLENIHIESQTKYSVADQISNANNYMPCIRINDMQCPKMVEMFENWSYLKDKDGKIIEGTLPEHNEFSHPGTAFYYGLINIYPPQKGELILP